MRTRCGVPRQGQQDGRTASARPGAARGAATGDDAAAGGARRPAEGPGSGGRSGRGALSVLLRGLRAGDLETVLLTVGMAAEENRMPSADPDEAARILDFLARLAAYDAALAPPCPDGAGSGPEGPSDAA